jgi:hypothetical protein
MSQSRYLDGNVVMNSDSVGNVLANYSVLHLQSIRRLKITVEVLDKNNETLEVLQGVSNGGSINIDGSSLIRRTGSLSFTLFDYLMPKKNSLLWITNRIRVYAGIDDLRTQDTITTHFCLGTFFITEPSVTLATDNRTITINLQDRMGQWEDEEFENQVLIEANTPVSEAMKSILTVMGEKDFSLIEDDGNLVPYNITFDQGSTVIDAIQKLRDLYMDWEAFYNTEGKFVFRKMTLVYDRDVTPQWIYGQNSPLLLGYQENYTYKGVKNRVVIFGAMDNKTGIVPRSQADLDPSSTFGRDDIGVKKKVLVETTLTTKEQCQAKAKYELWKASNLQEKITATSVPIYFLDANHIIEVFNPASQESERYIIDSISYGFTPSDQMTVQAHKVYYDDIILDAQDVQVDYIINSITNKGWLSIPEARIEQYYGLKGDGSLLVVNFQFNQSGGETAYTTGYLGTTTQTLTFDLADLGNGVGDNGDNTASGLSKGDYTDRIVGHEMVHAVQNNAFGMAKSASLPIWFKEGSAEFIHGADERLKISIVYDGKIDDAMLQYIINRGVALLNGDAWKGDSNEYSTGYLLMKYIDRNIKSGLDMKNFMATVQSSTHSGMDIIKEAIEANTVFTSFDNFVADFQANGANFVKTRITLNIDGDEQDTGSIGGSDHRGAIPLSAEDIFNESQATVGLISSGFVVQFDRP